MPRSTAMAFGSSRSIPSRRACSTRVGLGRDTSSAKATGQPSGLRRCLRPRKPSRVPVRTSMQAAFVAVLSKGTTLANPLTGSAETARRAT